MASPHSPPRDSPLLALPPELLTAIALALATLPPRLGPPSALLPLLLVCRRLHALLTWRGARGNKALWRAIGRAGFSALPPPLLSLYPTLEELGDPPPAGGARRVEGSGGTDGRMETLRTHLRTLRVLRTGDVYAAGAGAALRGAWAMLLADSLACSSPSFEPGVGVLPTPMKGGEVDPRMGLAAGTPALASLSSSSSSSGLGGSAGASRARIGKNRRQLAWAGARAFAMKWVRERMWEGRFGEGRSGSGDDGREGEGREWQVGWPRDTDAGAAALWVIWFFEDGDTLRAEPERARRHLLGLLLPFVVGPFRMRHTGAFARRARSAFGDPSDRVSVLVYLRRVVRVDVGAVIGVGAGAGGVPVVPVGVRVIGARRSGGGGARRVSPSSGDGAGWRARGCGSEPPRRGHAVRAVDGFPSSRHRASSRNVARVRQIVLPSSVPSLDPRSDSGSRLGLGSCLRAEYGRVRWLAGLAGWRCAQSQYASTLCPPHHYSVPLLPGVVAGGNGAPITVPTNHGAFPIYALGVPAPAPPSSPPRSPPPAARRPRSASPRRRPPPPRHARLLTAPPARLLFFARMQAGGRMGVPPHLARDRAEAGARWRAAGGAGPQPVGPTQADIHEKNARPVVRFERQLAEEEWAVDDAGEGGGEGEGEDGEGGGGGGRWAADAWRARLCRGYGGRGVWDAGDTSAGGAGSIGQVDGGRQGRGGAAPGRIGRVYELGSFAGLWAGTMLMPSEAPYNAILALPGGAFPPGGLVRDDFVAAARPVYIRIAEHHSFHPHPPLPPPPADSTTGEEGMHAGWLPPGARVVGVGGGRVEVRVAAAHEEAYVYETVLEGRVRDGAHDVERCPGCARVREGERRRRDRWAAEARRAVAGASGEGSVDGGMVDGGDEEPRRSLSPRSEAADSGASSSSPVSSTHSLRSSSPDRTSSDPEGSWPEWDAPAWAARGWDWEEEGWEGACDGVQDVVFTGATDPHHGMAWHHYEYAGRVRPWDGLIGLVMRPRDHTLGLATYFISGHLVGRDTFEGTWQMAAQDVLAPSWGGSVCFARGEE
ncbi:hypothetical protein DFH07DRAFT_784904 [Mycena maculata]|uniref:F-box domain-containing protein n=1 Tax=Mycena maculata TaxID=230809 RepID=A0AAD7MI60_9AGAR|nr:hypothetical protein DFH07DRAFT_784904 [Mycena maculata]